MGSVGTAGLLRPCGNREVGYVADTSQSLSSETIGTNRRKILKSFEL